MSDLSQYPPQDVALVTRVRALLQPTLDAFAPMSSVPVAFWGALVCGETGQWIVHNLDVPSHTDWNIVDALTQVENSVREKLWSIDKPRLDDWIGQGFTLLELGSSYGLTQIEGYNLADFKHTIAEANDPAMHFTVAAELLARNIEQFGLDPQKDFMELANTWNSGSPTSKTVPPEYAQNVVRRMEIWG